MVATKAFLLSISLMPVLMFGGIFFVARIGKMGDVSDKRLVIADATGGELFDQLQRAAEVRNARLVAAEGDAATNDGGNNRGDDEAGKNGFDGDDEAARQSRYVLERHSPDALDDAQRLALSDQVREGKLEAFVEVPPNVFADPAAGAAPPAVRFYGPNAMLSPERAWLEGAINDAVKARRLKALNLDPAAVARATASVPVAGRALVKKLSDGTISGGGEGEAQNMIGVFLPFGFMMLMFMVIMMSAQPLLESVMEEKSGRIAEVLLGSVSSFQLMLGKLLGNVAGSLSVVAIYAAGGYAAAAYNGWSDRIPWDAAPWFLVYQVLAVLLFSSIFMAVGAAVTQLKEAQSMLLPVWLMMCIPMFVWFQIVREPNGSIAVGLSFFPPSTPLVMVVRLAGEEVVPAWQIVATVAVMVASVAAITYLAARIFRIGMLWQGKTPKFSEMLRWAWSG
jgi:ABC-type Na+ efflux pump permease subunit